MYVVPERVDLRSTGCELGTYDAVGGMMVLLSRRGFAVQILSMQGAQ